MTRRRRHRHRHLPHPQKRKRRIKRGNVKVKSYKRQNESHGSDTTIIPRICDSPYPKLMSNTLIL
jgi:hypothetical protein